MVEPSEKHMDITIILLSHLGSGVVDGKHLASALSNLEQEGITLEDLIDYIEKRGDRLIEAIKMGRK